MAGLTGLLLAFVGFFLRDLHKKFSQLVERVNVLYTQIAQQSTATGFIRERNDEEIDALKERVSRLERRPIPMQ